MNIKKVNIYFFLYLFGYGNIERLDLTKDPDNNTTNVEWEIVQGSLEVSDSRCDADYSPGGTMRESTAVLSNNLIYIIGGSNDGSWTAVDCIISYNILTNNSNLVGIFPSPIRL